MIKFQNVKINVGGLKVVTKGGNHPYFGDVVSFVKYECLLVVA
jgi:hypothetical protein